MLRTHTAKGYSSNQKNLLKVRKTKGLYRVKKVKNRIDKSTFRRKVKLIK